MSIFLLVQHSQILMELLDKVMFINDLICTSYMAKGYDQPVKVHELIF